ncbi:MAG: peptidylprolyl isomerase [Candidatus Delongbacteria bacterium]|nr:peptidylprolyl isomerase [Candidatus Delongbacteria bacterium]
MKLSVQCLFWLIMTTVLIRGETVDRIAAVVGNEIILESEVQDMLHSYLMHQSKNLSAAEKESTRMMIMQQIINNKVLSYQAEKDSIEVTRQETEQSVDYRIKNLIQYFGSEDKLKQALENEGMNMRDLKKQYLEDAKAQILTDKIKMEKTKNIAISAVEVRSFYQSYQDSLPEQEEAIKISYIFLKSEDKFPEMARQYSQHAPTAANGGDLGWINIGQGEIMPELEQAMADLKLFDISQPIATRFGIQLIQIYNQDTLRKSNKIRHILFQSSATDQPEIMKRVELIRKELDLGSQIMKQKYQRLDSLRQAMLAGASFDDAAKQYSEDPLSKDSGGNVGWRPVDDFKMLFPDHYQQIEKLQPGQISPLLISDEGFYIIKALDHQAKRKLTLEEDWSVIEKYATEFKKNQIFNDWLAKISQNYYIEIK